MLGAANRDPGQFADPDRSISAAATMVIWPALWHSLLPGRASLAPRGTDCHWHYRATVSDIRLANPVQQWRENMSVEAGVLPCGRLRCWLNSFLRNGGRLGVRPVGVGSGGQSSWERSNGHEPLVKGAEHPTPVGAVPIRRELNAVPTLQAYAGGGPFEQLMHA